MKLTYSETTQHPVSAAFIEGASPEKWLAEINRWGVPFRELECYVLPESLRSVEPAGLLVVFKNSAALHGLDMKNPYCRVADRLFIPLHTAIHPEIGAEEWHRLLSWEVQVLHPTIGLVGFHHSDRLDPVSLLAESPAAGIDWSLAKPGLPPKPVLEYIEVRRPSPEEVMNSIREDLDTRPLADIPKEEEDEPTPLQKALDQAKRGVIKGTLNALDKLNDALPESKGGGSGWLNKFQDWLERNLQELERRRNNELQRLVNLFDKNSDEALKYAIPLDDSYATRGTAPPTWKLGPRSANFDLSRIGGGGAADTWDAGAYYNDLRSKYQKAAQEAIARGDFRKAAYIYAHLLSDFHSAANVLKQGGHFREAAVLYKDHLKNLPAAAGCLEEGGFFQEAIDVYDELKQYEKAGDLCQQIERPEKAAGYYEKSLEVLLNNEDHLNGARITNDKLLQPERARDMLLQGWQGNKQAETCLKQYFDRTVENEPEKTRQRIQDVFEQQTPRAKRPLFLNVLLHLNDQYPAPEVRDTSRHIAYEILGDAASRGDLSKLSTLSKFLPGDRMITSDTSRFIHHQKKAAAHRQAAARIQLDSSIQWLNATGYHNQFLAAGVKDGRLHLARGNWYGYVEYYSWEQPVYDNPRPAFVLNQHEHPQVIIRCAGRQSLEQKILPKNDHFDTELLVGCPDWLPEQAMGLSFDRADHLVALVDTHDKLELQYYTRTGELQRTSTCVVPGPEEIPASAVAGFPGLIAHGDRYYCFIENLLLRFDDHGKTEVSNTLWRIRQLCVSDTFQDFRMVALTDNGCALIQLDFEMEVRELDFFAPNFTPVTGAFLPGGRFVVASRDEVKLFHISKAGAFYQKSLENGSDVRRVAVLPVSDRDRCAILDAWGEIRVYEINQ